MKPRRLTDCKTQADLETWLIDNDGRFGGVAGVPLDALLKDIRAAYESAKLLGRSDEEQTALIVEEITGFHMTEGHHR